MTLLADPPANDAARRGRTPADTLRAGSSSFHAAAMLLDPQTRDSVRLLYGWCRHVDDVIDGQDLGSGGLRRSAPSHAVLEQLRRQTEAACAGEPQDDSVMDGLRVVVARHAIPQQQPLALLDGMAMDLSARPYPTLDDTLDYCYHVAGVVGLMVARVLGVEDERQLDRACDLGLAFQLSNIARDVLDDWRAGRIYLPLDWLAEEGLDPATLGERENQARLARVVARLVLAAEPYYESARVGVAALPPRPAWAIGTALRAYREIGLRVARGGPAALGERVVVPRAAKLKFAAAAGCSVAATAWLGTRLAAPVRRIAPRWIAPEPRPRHLWSRP